jgi:hypothetical protein
MISQLMAASLALWLSLQKYSLQNPIPTRNCRFVRVGAVFLECCMNGLD